MCGRYTLAVPGEVLGELFELAEVPAVEPRYNIAPTQEAPVVRTRRTAEGPVRRLDLLRWGLVPWWAEDPGVGARMINARVESAAERPAYRDAFRRQRCLVPADGFYEWKPGPGGRQPYWVHRPDGRPFAFAGLWSRWGRDERRLDSFTILTRAAPEGLRELHDRVPVILQPEDWAAWLDPSPAEPGDLLAALARAGGDLVPRPVGRRVNRPDNDDPALIEAAPEAPAPVIPGLFDVPPTDG
jgi:putative SOS response-associated peptidase YedK